MAFSGQPQLATPPRPQEITALLRALADFEGVIAVANVRDTAVILACCDLVIPRRHGVCAPGWALGLPTWVLLHSTPDGRRGHSGATCSWLPGLRLDRQDRPGEWPSVIAQVQTALEQF